MDVIRIILVEDHQLLRACLRSLFATEATFHVVGEAANAEEAFDRVRSSEHDLVIVDISLLGPMNGIALMRELRRRGEKDRILVLTMHEHTDFVLDAFASGANGYALKAQSPGEIFEAIRVTAAGGRYLAPKIAPVVKDIERRPRHTLGTLSPREREIFALLVQGYSNARVASHFLISIKTVETHRTRIMRKLEAHNIGDLVRFAARHGLLAASTDGASA
jgi:two-component system response regulator NreC